MTKLWAIITAPFRATIAGLMVLVNLTGRQMRALFSIAMLGGMIANSITNWFYIRMVHHMVEDGEVNMSFFGMIMEQMRFNSGLTAWFAVILGLIVFGADYLRAKHGETEISFGKGDDAKA